MCIRDSNDIIRETLSDGAAFTYVHGPGVDEPLARQDGQGNFIYYHADAQGSVRTITNDAGVVVQAYEYDEWGNIANGSAVSGYAYTGREWDPETGFYYYRARYYDPVLARFISEDPAGDGPNPYVYCGNSPTNAVDPLGLFSIWDFLDDLLYHSAQFSAGLGDNLSFGITGWIRRLLGSDGLIDRNGAGYIIGDATGTGVSIGMGLAHMGVSVAAQSTRGGMGCLLYTSPSPRDRTRSRMPSSA